MMQMEQILCESAVQIYNTYITTQLNAENQHVLSPISLYLAIYDMFILYKKIIKKTKFHQMNCLNMNQMDTL